MTGLKSIVTGRDNWAVVWAAAVCSAVGSFDLGGVNVVLPELAQTFHVEPAAVQWVVLAYLLPIAALALPTGRWLDVVGRRSSMVLLVTGFLISSILVGLSPTLAWVIIARGLQGCFGAGLFALTAVLAFEAVRPAKRMNAVALLSTISPLGGIAGPSVGAFIAQAFGWQWIFWLNVPVLACTIIVFAIRLPAGGSLRWPSLHFVSEALLLGVATAAVLLALTWAPEYGLAWFALAFVAVPCLIAWRLTHRGSPVLKLAVIPGFSWSLVTLALITATTMSVQYLVAFFAQRDLGLTVAQTGLALLFTSIATIPTSLIAGWLANRIRPGLIAAAGLTVIALSAFLTAILDPNWSFAALAGLALILGAGQGLANSPSTNISLSFSPPEMMATAGAASSFLRNIGFTAGPALATAIWALGDYTLPAMRVAFIVIGVLSLLGVVSVFLAVRPAPTFAR